MSANYILLYILLYIIILGRCHRKVFLTGHDWIVQMPKYILQKRDKSRKNDALPNIF